MGTGGIVMENEIKYKHLEHRPCSAYRQMFVKGRKLRAWFLYDETRGDEPMTPEEIAADYDLPLEVVLEAIDYCKNNLELIYAEIDREWEDIRRLGLDKPPFVPPDHVPDK